MATNAPDGISKSLTAFALSQTRKPWVPADSPDGSFRPENTNLVPFSRSIRASLPPGRVTTANPSPESIRNSREREIFSSNLEIPEALDIENTLNSRPFSKLSVKENASTFIPSVAGWPAGTPIASTVQLRRPVWRFTDENDEEVFVKKIVCWLSDAGEKDEIELSETDQHRSTGRSQREDVCPETVAKVAEIAAIMTIRCEAFIRSGWSFVFFRLFE